MAKTPFKMRSGNATPFKMMGSSPLKKETDWAAMHETAKKKYGEQYKSLSTEEYKTEALRQAKSKKETGKYDAVGVYDYKGKKRPTVKETDTSGESKDTKGEVKKGPKVPVVTSREDTRKQKHEGKVKAMGKDTPGGTDITRAEQADIKVKKLTTKQETAVAEGKTKKAARLEKRVSKRKIKAEKLTAKAAARERGGGEISASDRKAIKTQKLKSKLATVDADSRKGKRIAKRIKNRADKAASDKVYVAKDKKEVTIKG